MTSHLQHLLDLIRQSEKLSDADKAAIEKAVKEADKAFEITNFKLDRTEKVKRTTAILLEETIAELEQKRKAVEAQSRELEIETAVERVRADAMAMHSTNDFEKVSQQLLKQVKTLNLEGFTGASICLIDENQFMSWWDFSSPGNIGDPKSQSFRYDAKKFKILGLDVLATWQQGESYMLLDFDLEKLHAATKEWEEINIDVANTFKKVISEGKLTHQWNPSGRLSKGFLTFDMLQPPTEDVRKITIKMAHAFDQAYTRFLDLQKAEAQARESQIQLALERVRARTMAMHHSSELADTAKILFQQIKELGYEMWSCGFGIWRPEVDLEEAWMSTGDLFPIILIPFREDPTHLSIYEAAQRGESVFEVEVKGEVLTRHYDWLMSQPSFKIVFGQIENSGIILPKVQWKYAAFFKQGYLHLITTQPQPDIHDISSRFAKVFEQTYTRFLDLQKAEAQARESQIQLALERVRARTMAMHKSEELTEVAVILYKELRSLGVTQEFFECGYMEIDQVNKIQRGWMTGPDGNLLEPFNLPLTGESVFDSRCEAWKLQTPVFHQVVAGEQLKRHLEFAIPYFDSKETEEIARTQVPGSIVFYCGNFSHGYLAINCGLLLDAEAESLIARFTRVFEMTYLRFLDLKKAEAQAREALIEASLERVRSRAMAMQHSVELSSLISVVYAELTKLDVTFDRCFIMMFDTETNGATWWMASPEAPELSRGFKLPYHEYGPHLAYLQGWKERKEKWEYVAEGEVKRNWDDYIFSETELSSLPEAAKAYMKSVPRVCLSASFNTFGCLTLGSNEPLTDEAFSVLVRFARVFEICYTRFNDLKQAEAQAKEAQIEAALERVRSRTMGMQKSEELRDVIQIIYEQFLHLKIPIDGAGFAMDYMESDDFNFWLADASSAFPYQVHIPYFDHPQFNRHKEAKEKGLDFYTSSLTCEERNGFFDHISQYIPIPQELKKVVHSAPGYETSHVVLKNVILYILNFSGLSFSDADNATLLRFGKVFEQTYTRFNDLKQAEAQAREAQIEVALERVRSRSMAMQKSEELAEVIKVTFDQLLNLNINIDTAGFNLELRETDDWNLWVADRYNSLPSEVHIPYFDDPLSNAIIETKNKGLSLLEISLTFEEKNKMWAECFKVITVPEEGQKQIFNSPGYHMSMVFMQRVGLYIQNYDGIPYKAEDNATLLRFGKMFEQTYIRFNDLKQAEAQARESQIQLALERVRARTMAMQRSEELPEVAALLFQQVKTLGVPQFHCGFNIFEIDDKECIWYPGSADGDILPPCKIPLTEHPVFMAFNESRKRGDELFVYEKEGEYQAGHYRYMLSLPVLGEILQNMLDAGIPFPTFQIDHLANFSHGNLLFITSEHFPEMHDTFKRFAKVFEQTYTRFLDLQKAEAQAREAQIEAALERVRSRSLAMHKSDELRDVIKVVFEKLQELDFGIDGGAFIMIPSEDLKSFTIWIGDNHAEYPNSFILQYYESPAIKDMWDAKVSGTEFLSRTYFFEEKNHWFIYAFENTDIKTLPEELKNWILQQEYLTQSVAWADNSGIGIHFHHLRTLAENEVDVLKRFSKVFDQAYIRFLDLQKSEAQAREAQIEAALERVRSRSMGMQKSDELRNVVQVIYDQFLHLGIDIFGADFRMDYRDREDWHIWSADRINSFPSQLHIPYFDHPFWIAWNNAKRKGVDLLTYTMGLEEKNSFVLGLSRHIPDMSAEGLEIVLSTPGYSVSNVFLQHIALSIDRFKPEPFADADNAILMRFAKVFEQTYTRFLDLQKAEAQAREAQIEAALERVRAASMAMHHSNELNKVVATLLDRLISLGLLFNAGLIWTFDREKQSIETWIATPVLPDPVRVQLPYDPEFKDNLIVKKFWHSFEKGEDALNEVFNGNIKNQYFECITRYNDEAVMPQHLRELVTTLDWTVSYAAEKNSLVGIDSWSDQKLSDEEFQILKRVARVFEQAYVRFLDLQKAEANAREANIEAALEKVRGKAMAMHNSNDLIATAGVLFAEMRKLGINTFRCGVGLLNKENRKTKLYSATTTGETDNLPVVGWTLLEGHEVLTEMYERWLRNEDYFPVLNGELLKTYYEKINPTFTVPVEQTAQYEQHGFFLPFSEGLFYGWAEQPFIEGEVKILQRFKAIVDLTFRRYMELQKSEEVAREAVRSASLDRVRAEIASMRTVQDLDRITPLIWRELTTLGITFVRCGVFIMDEEKQIIHTFLSTPDGKAIAAFHLPYGSTTNLADAIKGWRTHQRYVTRWTDKDFQSQADILVQQGSIATREQYLSTIPKEGIYLHFLPFLQGMLYVGHTAQLHDNDLNLIQSVADAFSTAYARYEDFNKLEAAKKQVDKTLTDLRQTQQQLVQSEKMASLGELTAGIAHEIQNPLNFVNNFSEVSNELLKDLQDIRRNSNVTSETSEEDELLKNIAGNLEKINHHGKRAADIVKGMLQHSRTSTGQKELTDINTVAEEYLRLAYHGLRAKDKSFNARFETNLDPTLPKLNVIPQDIGRVLLNLINNAFYAVSEKSSYAKASEDKYEPTVIVSTKNLGNTIEISVKDNGNGIPDSIKDKIFQPFFTTKPTGQGTGLGLSLSYEIVKAHGGELKVETREGEGSEFIIQLPVV